ncbi:MAG: TonB-dependent receptor [Endomicrobia bacterium]|nr:TonB-dependent receptor [Endomicrobiia bacterium]MDW8056195.1 TonB-dependent receptor [Elusimicrobiota bacterium]
MKRILLALITFTAVLFCTEKVEEISILAPTEVYLTVTAKKGFVSNPLLTPGNVTVITAEEIQNSGVYTVGELLRRVSGVVVRDFYYDSPYASIDLRGFGESAAQNCVVLIDGRRLNNIDMSNVDINQISLAHIERIEIFKGGASVLYGDGAVGGVINIITKKATSKESSLKVNVNSFGGQDVRFSLENTKEISYVVSGTHRYNRGYRNNNEISVSGVNLKLSGSEQNTEISWEVDTGLSTSKTEFPGYVSQHQWEKGEIEKTSSPQDKGSKIDYYAKLSGKKNFSWFDTETSISYRNIDQKTFMYSFSSHDKRITHTVGIEQKFRKRIKEQIDTLFGIEYYFNLYKISPMTLSGEVTPQTDELDLLRNSFGSYLNFSIPIHSILLFDVGGRFEIFNQDFKDLQSNIEKHKDETINAISAGLTTKIMKNLTSYVKWSKSYRLPKTDEYISWGTYYDLKPQTGQDLEVGLKYRQKKINLDLSIFTAEIKNEIYYNMLTWQNENYPSPSVRQGVETAIKILPTKFLTTNVEYSYVDAKFKSGPYENKYVPLVPQHKYNIGITFLLPYNVNLSVDNITVSDRFFGSDYVQTGKKLYGYSVTDVKLEYKVNDFKIFAKINNLTNEKYAEFAYAGMGYLYYPSPVRNYSAGINFRF